MTIGRLGQEHWYRCFHYSARYLHYYFRRRRYLDYPLSKNDSYLKEDESWGPFASVAVTVGVGLFIVSCVLLITRSGINKILLAVMMAWSFVYVAIGIVFRREE